MRAAAALDRFGVHETVPDPEPADLVLFVETSDAAGPYFEATRRHPVYRAHREKSYLFCSTDRVVPFLPGVFASIERRWAWPAWARSGHYLGVREEDGMRYEAAVRPSLLFSFIGSAAAHPVRRAILGLPAQDALLIDSAREAEEVARGERTGLAPGEFRDRYTRSIEDSAFVLCPRGGGTASFRLFEAMMLGRAPVIISDQWVPPTGPDWPSFSLRVKESDVDRVPAILREHAGRAEEMGRCARAAWVEWFAPEVGFHRVVESCVELSGAQGRRRGLRRYEPWLQMLRPYNLARWGARRLPRR
jgi:hypothetical protein